jgi:hypothetical protein
MVVMCSKLCQWKDTEGSLCFIVTHCRTRRKGREEGQQRGEVNRNMGGRRNKSRCKGVKVVHVRKLVVMLECLLFCTFWHSVQVLDKQSKGSMCNVTWWHNMTTVQLHKFASRPSNMHLS